MPNSRAYDRAYYLKHRERKIAAAKRRYREHRDEILLLAKVIKNDHTEARRQYESARWAMIKSDPMRHEKDKARRRESRRRKRAPASEPAQDERLIEFRIVIGREPGQGRRVTLESNRGPSCEGQSAEQREAFAKWRERFGWFK